VYVTNLVERATECQTSGRANKQHQKLWIVVQERWQKRVSKVWPIWPIFDEWMGRKGGCVFGDVVELEVIFFRGVGQPPTNHIS